MIRTALQLAERGLHVFPCQPRSKLPASTHGFKDASTDPDTIRQWWRSEPQYNIGIATGTVSGIFVVDLDGYDAEFELRRLEAEHGALPPTVEAITARGRHAYFKMPNTPVRNSASKIAPGIDTRGDGGYVLAPPSIHPSGKQYCWSVDCAKGFAEAPAWLLDKIIGQRANGSTAPTPPSEWRTLMANGVPEGQRDCTLARISGYLLRHHIDPVFAAGLVQIFNATRCIPPLPEKDVARIMNSIAAKEFKRRQPDG